MVLVEAPKPGIVEVAIPNYSPCTGSCEREFIQLAPKLSISLNPNQTVTGIKEGAIIEVTSGPFKGEKAGVTKG